jgi:hypothetical protein
MRRTLIPSEPCSSLLTDVLGREDEVEGLQILQV